MDVMRKNLICLLLLIFSEIIVYAQAEAGDGWDGTVAAKFAGGTGEALDPYLISNAAQLAKLATDVNNGNTYKDKFFELTADIVLNNSICKDKDSHINVWQPIGSDRNPFMGNFDGQLHSVTGVYVSDNCSCHALFGYLGADGIIQNLSVIDSQIGNRGNYRGICCFNNNGSIINCYTSNCVMIDN